jgi:hypothetical protein
MTGRVSSDNGQFHFEALPANAWPFALRFIRSLWHRIFLCGLIGGQIADLPFHFHRFSALALVLLVSAVVRLLVAAGMLPLIREVREVEHFGIKEARERMTMFSAVDILRILSMKSGNPRR